MDITFNSLLRQAIKFCLICLIFGFSSIRVAGQLEIPENTLSFTPDNLIFSVEEGGVAPAQSSTLTSTLETSIIVSLAKSPGSDWLILPSPVLELLTFNLDPLSFGVNASGLSPGIYTSIVTASSPDHVDATLQVTLTVTEPLALSFSPTTLSFSVKENGTVSNKTSTLSANTGSPAVNLTKTANSNWLILPTSDLGSLSFGINSSGLSPGTYTSTVTASAENYIDATLKVTLTVTEPLALSFSPTTLSFSVKENGTVSNKTSTLSANTGSPAVNLTKTANSNWLILPTSDLGSLSFGINSSGLSPGTYTSTVTASAENYIDATLKVTLTVTEPSALSFSPTTLSFSIEENGTASNKTSTLSANTGSPAVNLTKTANSDWLILPTSDLGALSFGINSFGLSPGTYTSTVTASAENYIDATLQVTLTITAAPALSFTPTSLSFSVVQNGTVSNKTSTLSANTGTPTVILSKSANSDWLVLPASDLGALSFSINSSALAVGTYTSTVTASATGYASGTLQVTLTVTAAPALSFTPTSLSFSVVQNGTTTNKTSTLSANTGTPNISLSKSANSDWLILPASDLGALSFSINSSGLAVGTYTSTVTASATGYAIGTLQITLTVTAAPALSFTPTSLSFSVVQNGTTTNKNSTLSSNTGTPTIVLSKSANSDWLILPASDLGSLSFGINSSELAVGTYTSTVTASATGYAIGTLQITLTVTAAPALSFTPTSLSFSVVQNGTTTNKNSTLSSNTGTPTVSLSKSANSDWLILPASDLGSLSFGINSSELAVGTYTSTVTASATGYAIGTLQITLTVTAAPALSFTPTSLSFSVVQNGTTTNKNSTLSSNTGTPTVSLSKSANSDWLILPASDLGALSFGINSSGLAVGTYTSTVTASATGYASGTLQVTLTVTAAPALSFTPTSLSFSVVQNGTVSNKTSTLSANTGTPTVILSKSANSNWLILPASALGSLSFGINSSGLAVGTYTSTVTASATGYASGTLQVTLTVTAAPALSFTPTSLSFSVVQNGTVSNKTSTLSANTGTPTVILSKSANSNWLILPASALGSLSFGINSSGLAVGTYTSTVTASATGYASGTLQVTLTITAAPALSFTPTSLSFSVVQNSTTTSKISTLSANTGTPTIALSKSANSNWLILPTSALGSLSFGINSSGLAVGTYTSTVTASAAGYASATLQVTLTVTAAPALSFTPTSLSFSVVQNGTVSNKTSTLSANTGTPTVALSKSANSNWLILPTSSLGSLSFGINSSGLAVGTYTSIVTASATGYASGTLQVTLTVTAAPALSFSPTSLSFSVVQNGTTISKTSTLSANTGTPTITLSRSSNSNWLILPTSSLGSLSFGINSSGLAVGTYTSIVTASATGYASGTLQVTLTVTAAPALSFSPTSLSFSVVQNGTTTSKTSTLSANTGTPTITLSKSANSNWLILPTSSLGSLSFGINSSGLAVGTYTSTVTASSAGYTSGTLQITLNVTAAPRLSFSPTSLSFSVVQNGTTTNKTSTLSANTGTPSVVLSKSANSNWLILPTSLLGSLSFGINSTGLAVGTYTSTVTASATGYASATLQVTLTITAAPALSFSPTSLSFSVVQNGTVANKNSTLSANTGTPTVALSKSANSNWLILPTSSLGSLSFGINSSGLAAGTYTSPITASATGYASAILNITLTVTTGSSSTLTSLNINFQSASPIPPAGWVRDYGQPFGLRSSTYQGSGASYGWLDRLNKTPLDLTSNGRLRNTPADILLATFMHVQGNHITGFTGTSIEGIWEAHVANGTYDVTVSVGDGTEINSKHSINVEGVSAIDNFVPTTSIKFKSATIRVSVTDGFLTIDAIGGTNTKLNWVKFLSASRPSVLAVNPPNNATNISENTSISTDILNLPNGGINNATVTSSSVYLTENQSGVTVPANVNGTGGGDAITLVPASALKLNTTYKFTITAGVKDLSGASFNPYTSLFTTKASSSTTSITAKFSRVELPNAAGRHSSLKIGPDGKLYALTIDGIIKRFSINADGTLGTPQLIYSLQDAYGVRTQRVAVGFTFDPSATSTNLIAWVTHSSYTFLNAPAWDGKLSKLSGNNLQTVQDVIINLPRSVKDHLTNSLAFGPDGALYFTQGSNSAMGKADTVWGMRDEHLLSGALLRLDRSKLGSLPLNAKTPEGGGSYNPYLSTSPLTIYASGVRNAYDLLWHSNGQLYVPTNGSAAGGNTPASVRGTLRPNGTTYNGPTIPALNKVQQTQKDFLFRVVKGGYYGHPNALRGEYVLNGGNPTAATDSAQINTYPVGTLPDANWKKYSFDFQNNKSPNGVIEYKSSTFNGSLKGKILVVRYSQNDDIITLTPGGSTKDIISSTEGALIQGFTGFVDPLDLIENVNNGNIYVSEYGGEGKIVLLKPIITTNAPVTLIAKPEEIMNTQMAVHTSPSVMNIPSCDEPSGVFVPAIVSADSLPLWVSNTENVFSAQSNLQSPKVYPNPLEKTFNIYFPQTYAGDVILQLTNPVGKVYEIGKLKLSTRAARTFKVNVSNLFLRSGIYFLRIVSERKTEVIKLLVK